MHVREQRDSDARQRRWSGITKCSKFTNGSRRGGGRTLFVALIDAILRGRATLFQAATQPPEPPSIPKYPGWLVWRASNIFLCCWWVSQPMMRDFWQWLLSLVFSRSRCVASRPRSVVAAFLSALYIFYWSTRERRRSCTEDK